MRIVSGSRLSLLILSGLTLLVALGGSASAGAERDRALHVLVRLDHVRIPEDRLGLLNRVGIRPEVLILVDDEVQFSSAGLPSQVQGDVTRFPSARFTLTVRPGQTVTVKLVKARIWRFQPTLVEARAPADRLHELFTRPLAEGGCEVALSREFESGLYRVVLHRTYVDASDFEAVGRGQNQALRLSGPLAALPAGVQNGLNDLKQRLGDSLEAIDPVVIVRKGGEVVFDSSRVRTPQGADVEWELPFELRWHPGDALSVELKDADTTSDDSVFTPRVASGPASITLLQGRVQGGRLGRSYVELSADRVGP